MNIPDEERHIGRVTILSSPGPWKWFGFATTNSVYLATQRWGRHYVMDFVRWGMRQAQPRFQSPEQHLMVKVADLAELDHNEEIPRIRNADAVLLEKAPDLLKVLLQVAFAVTPEDDEKARTAAADLALELERIGVIKIERPM